MGRIALGEGLNCPEAQKATVEASLTDLQAALHSSIERLLEEHRKVLSIVHGDCCCGGFSYGAKPRWSLTSSNQAQASNVSATVDDITESKSLAQPAMLPAGLAVSANPLAEGDASEGDATPKELNFPSNLGGGDQVQGPCSRSNTRFATNATTSTMANGSRKIIEAHKAAKAKAHANLQTQLSKAQTAKVDMYRTAAKRLVRASWFQFLTCCIIFVNALAIGVELELDLRPESSDSSWIRVLLDVLENLFLLFYLFEISLAVFAWRRKAFTGQGGSWLKFDAFLVSFNMLSTWVIAPIADAAVLNRSVADIAKRLLILRMARIFRLVRALRAATYFDCLGRLVTGMLSSAPTMVSAFALILLTVYIFSCAAAEVITKSSALRNHTETGPIIEKHFDSLPTIMMTLMQFATGDSMAAFYAPLVYHEPWLAIFFGLCVIVISVLLMNLVIALVLEDSFTRASKDREARLVKMRHKFNGLRPWVESAFDELDKSNVGAIALDEIVEGLGHLQHKLPEDLESFMNPDMLVDLFEYLDIDGSGEISKDEFINGVMHLALNSIPVETTRIIELLRSQRCMIMQMQHETATTTEAFRLLMQKQGIPWPVIEDLKKEVHPRLTVTIERGRGLRNADLAGASDPYCVCAVPGKNHTAIQTQVVHDSLNPVWNYKAVMSGYIRGDPLLFSVWDKDPHTLAGFDPEDDPLGIATLSSEEFCPDGYYGELKLEGDGADDGYIIVKIEHDAKADVLVL